MNSVLIFTSNIFHLLSQTHSMHTKLSKLFSTHRVPSSDPHTERRSSKLRAPNPDPHTELHHLPHAKRLSPFSLTQPILSMHGEFPFSISQFDPLISQSNLLISQSNPTHFSSRSPSFLRSTLSSLHFSQFISQSNPQSSDPHSSDPHTKNTENDPADPPSNP